MSLPDELIEEAQGLGSVDEGSQHALIGWIGCQGHSSSSDGRRTTGHAGPRQAVVPGSLSDFRGDRCDASGCVGLTPCTVPRGSDTRGVKNGATDNSQQPPPGAARLSRTIEKICSRLSENARAASAVAGKVGREIDGKLLV